MSFWNDPNDPLDDDLGRQLSRLGARSTNSASALKAVHTRAGRLRRRRAVLRTSVAGGVLALSGGVAVALNAQRTAGVVEKLQAADRNGVVTTTRSSAAIAAPSTGSLTTLNTATSSGAAELEQISAVDPTTIAPLTNSVSVPGNVLGSSASTIVPSTARVSSTTRRPATTTTSIASTAPTSSVVPVSSTEPGSSSSEPSSTVTSSSSTSTSTAPSTTTLGVARSFSCAGGTISVRAQGDRLVVVSGPTAAAGYVIGEQKINRDEIEVKFAGPTECAIKLKLSNGDVVQESDD
jgi:hypothetical protein